jgi:hypothetical protein
VQRDRVAAPEDLERRQCVQACGELRERGPLRLGQRLRLRHQCRVQPAPTPAVLRQQEAWVDTCQPLRLRDQAGALALDPERLRVRERGMQALEPAPDAVERAAWIPQLLAGSLEPQPQAAEPHLDPALERALGRLELRAKHALLRYDQLGGIARRRSAYVRDQIRDADIHLVPDGAHDRDATLGDRARHPLVVEREQVFCRAATAPDDHDVELGDALDRVQRSDDRLGCIAALNEARGYDDPHRAAPMSAAHDVVQRGTGWARHDPEHARQARQRALALGRQ